MKRCNTRWLLGSLAATIILATAATARTGSQTAVYIDEGGDRLVFRADATVENAIGAGTIGTDSTGFSLTETGDGVTHRTTFTLASGFEYLMTDSGANGGHASLKLYDLPAGYIKFVGAAMDLAIDCDTTGAAVADAATYDFGVGTTTTGTDNAALATTEQDVITKLEGDMDHAAVAAIHKAYGTDVLKDGTSTAGDLYFNLAIEADDAAADSVCVLSGTIAVTWVNLGDY